MYSAFLTQTFVGISPDLSLKIGSSGIKSGFSANHYRTLVALSGIPSFKECKQPYFQQSVALRLAPVTP